MRRLRMVLFRIIFKLFCNFFYSSRFSKTIQMIPALLEILQYLAEEVCKIFDNIQKFLDFDCLRGVQFYS